MAFNILDKTLIFYFKVLCDGVDFGWTFVFARVFWEMCEVEFKSERDKSLCVSRETLELFFS
jgi:hypothetical protein